MFCDLDDSKVLIIDLLVEELWNNFWNMYLLGLLKAWLEDYKECCLHYNAGLFSGMAPASTKMPIYNIWQTLYNFPRMIADELHPHQLTIAQSNSAHVLE